MKTVQSFFPTTTKSKASFKKQVTYKVMKKVLDDNDLEPQQELASHKSTGQLVQSRTTAKIENIFRDKNNEIKNFCIDELNERPIGGAQLFKKMEKSNNSGIEESSRRLSKKGSKKNIKQSRQKIPFSQFKSQPNILVNEKDKYFEQFKPETFKAHADCKQAYTFTTSEKLSIANSVMKYQSQAFPMTENLRKCSTSEKKGARISGFNSCRMKQNLKNRTHSSKCSSAQSLKTPTQADKIHIKWATQQQRNYLDKMAILNEINYNRPLIQKLGDRYFQGILRNRYMDEPEYKNKSPFIYQIKDKMSDTKFISKIKSNFFTNKLGMKCNFMERNKIVLKGRSKIALEQERNTYKPRENIEGRKRWQEFNEDSFLE